MFAKCSLFCVLALQPRPRKERFKNSFLGGDFVFRLNKENRRRLAVSTVLVGF